jgi:hypothetical protein
MANNSLLIEFCPQVSLPLVLLCHLCHTGLFGLQGSVVPCLGFSHYGIDLLLTCSLRSLDFRLRHLQLTLQLLQRCCGLRRVSFVLVNVFFQLRRQPPRRIHGLLAISTLLFQQRLLISRVRQDQCSVYFTPLGLR